MGNYLNRELKLLSVWGVMTKAVIRWVPTRFRLVDLTDNTFPTPWIKTYRFTALVITSQKLNNLCSCNGNITLKVAGIPAAMCWWEYCEYNISKVLKCNCFIYKFLDLINARKREHVKIKFTFCMKLTYIFLLQC
jgi:hypothetical protein